MRQKQSSLTQIEMNQLATKRLIEEMKQWNDDLVADVLGLFNEGLDVTISTLKELEDLPNIIEVEKYAEILDDILDDIAGDDGFGTEQQCDPRGDFRSQQWSMWNVEE